MRIGLADAALVATIAALIVYYVFTPTNLLVIAICLGSLSFVFTMYYIYGLRNRYWVLLAVAISGSVTLLVFPVTHSLVIQYIVLLMLTSYYLHFTGSSENIFIAYLAIAIIALIVSIYQNMEYFPWIILGPIAEMHADELITGSRNNKKLVYIKLLIGLALDLPFPLLVLTLITGYMYQIHGSRDKISVVDEAVRLITMIILGLLGGV